MESFVRAAALTHFAEVSKSLGYNADAALRRIGLSPRVLNEPELRLSSDRVAQLLEDAAQATGCDTFALRMLESRQLSNFGAISLLLTHQATLRDVLTTLIQHLYLLNTALAIQVEDAGDLVIVREEVMSAQPSRQSVELAIGVLYRLCASLMGSNWRPRSVNFAHNAPADTARHRALFRCPVVFDADFNGLVCRAADLDVPNPSADPQLARFAKTILETLPELSGGSMSRDVRRAIYLTLPSGCATAEWVAQSLGRSLRTLQRQLDEEGTSFSVVMTEVRSELALRYIENPRYSLGRMAEMLGYGTHSAFTRWFSQRFGCAPVAWRAGRRPAGVVTAVPTAPEIARSPSAHLPATGSPSRGRAAT